MIQQLIYIGFSFLLLPCLPFLVYGGRRVKARVPALPEASQYRIGQIEGNATTIRLLTLGESSMAGVGVTDPHDGITFNGVHLCSTTYGTKKEVYQI